jgi:hypothetical protein
MLLIFFLIVYDIAYCYFINFITVNAFGKGSNVPCKIVILISFIKTQANIIVIIIAMYKGAKVDRRIMVNYNYSDYTVYSNKLMMFNEFQINYLYN